MSFSSETALKAALVAACTNAVAQVEDKVYGEFAGNLNQYYTEFMPAEYIRTGALYGSLDRTGVQSSGSGASAEVFFDTPSYQNGWVPLQSGDYGYATWSGEKVLNTAMHGSHGGYVGGTAIWDDSISSLGGKAGIKAMLIEALKAQGL
jgi:hypothetical protein